MIKFIAILILPILLSSCGTMSMDCQTLTGDRDAYRNCMAQQGDAFSQYELALAAYDAEDYPSAINWLKRAAAPKRAGDMPNYAASTESNRYKSLYTIEEVPMTQGHQGAQRLLVRIYEEGIGVPVNPKEAERYRDMINPQ